MLILHVLAFAKNNKNCCVMPRGMLKDMLIMHVLAFANGLQIPFLQRHGTSHHFCYIWHCPGP
jgi:hypothetical protein